MKRRWIILGAVSGAAAVGMGAAAAHALRAILPPEQLALVTLAVDYQMWHALALLAVGLLTARLPGSRLLTLSGSTFVLGSCFFCGGLYNLAFGGPTVFHPLVPMGGGLFILGWLSLAGAAVFSAKPDP